MIHNFLTYICDLYDHNNKVCYLSNFCDKDAILCNVIDYLDLLLESFGFLTLSGIFLGLSITQCRKSIYLKTTFDVKNEFYNDLFFKFIEVPSKRSLFFWISLLIFVLHALKMIFSKYLILNSFLPVNAQNLELIIAATSIIFPLLILIIDTKDSDDKGLFSNSEVLLRHAYAFPISIILIVFLIFSIFQIPKGLLTFMTIIALSLTAFILVRLLQVYFKPDIWKKSEESLVQHKIYASILDIINSRIAHNNILKKIENFKPVIETFYMGDKKNSYQVTTHKTGIVTEINQSILKNIYNEQYKSQVSTEGDSPSLQHDEADHGVTIRILAYPGNEINSSGDAIAIIYSKDGTSPELIEKLASKVESSFKIEQSTDSKSATDQISLFLDKSIYTGRNAIENRNPYLLKRLSSIYFYIARCTIESFEYFDIDYNSKNVRNENFNLFPNQKEWTSVERLFENISDLIFYIFNTKSQSDHQLTQEVRILPHRICLLSYNHKDYLFFTRATNQLLILKRYESKTENKSTLSSFDNLLKYNIIPDLEANYYDSDKTKIIKRYYNNVFASLASMGCFALEEAKDSIIINLLSIFAKTGPFEHKYLRKEQEIARVSRQNGNKETQEKEIKKLQQKIAIIDYDKKSKQEILISLLGYIVLLGHNNARKQFKGKNKALLLSYFSQIFSSISYDLKEILELTIEGNKREFTEKWGMKFLEYMPEQQAKIMQLPSIIDKIIGAIIIDRWQAANMPSDIDLSEYEKDDMIVFNKEIGVRKYIADSNKILLDANRSSLTKTEIDKLSTFFDNITKQADIKTSLKIARTRIEQNMIDNDILSFANNFSENLKIRLLFNISIHSEKVENGTSWGVNQLIPKESFLPDSTYPSPSEIYANDLANSEDEYLFKLMQESSTQLEFNESIDNTIMESLPNSLNLTDIVIITSRDLYVRDSLSKSDNFKSKHQEEAKNGIFSNADGFLTIENIQIPVYQIFMRDNTNKRHLIIINRNKIQLNFDKSPFDIEKPVGSTGLYYDLVDPLDDKNLAQKILKQKPNWLKDYPENKWEKLVSKMVWLRIFEKVYISNSENNIYHLKLESED